MSVSWRSRSRRINRLSTHFTTDLEGVGVGEDLEDSETQQQQLKPTKSVLSSSICSMPRVRIYSGEAHRATHFPTMLIRTPRISTREYRRCSHISLRKRKGNAEYQRRIGGFGVLSLLGLTSGFFLFTATDDLLPKAHRRSSSFVVPIATWWFSSSR